MRGVTGGGFLGSGLLWSILPQWSSWMLQAGGSALACTVIPIAVVLQVIRAVDGQLKDQAVLAYACQSGLLGRERPIAPVSKTLARPASRVIAAGGGISGPSQALSAS